jgi:Trk-type K+ transport system membrane component
VLLNCYFQTHPQVLALALLLLLVVLLVLLLLLLLLVLLWHLAGTSDACRQQLWQQPGLHHEQHLRDSCHA